MRAIRKAKNNLLQEKSITLTEQDLSNLEKELKVSPENKSSTINEFTQMLFSQMREGSLENFDILWRIMKICRRSSLRLKRNGETIEHFLLLKKSGELNFSSETLNEMVSHSEDLKFAKFSTLTNIVNCYFHVVEPEQWTFQSIISILESAIDFFPNIERTTKNEFLKIIPEFANLLEHSHWEILYRLCKTNVEIYSFINCDWLRKLLLGISDGMKLQKFCQLLSILPERIANSIVPQFLKKLKSFPLSFPILKYLLRYIHRRNEDDQNSADFEEIRKMIMAEYFLSNSLEKAFSYKLKQMKKRRFDSKLLLSVGPIVYSKPLHIQISFINLVSKGFILASEKIFQRDVYDLEAAELFSCFEDNSWNYVYKRKTMVRNVVETIYELVSNSHVEFGDPEKKLDSHVLSYLLVKVMKKGEKAFSLFWNLLYRRVKNQRETKNEFVEKIFFRNFNNSSLCLLDNSTNLKNLFVLSRLRTSLSNIKKIQNMRKSAEMKLEILTSKFSRELEIAEGKKCERAVSKMIGSLVGQIPLLEVGFLKSLLEIHQKENFHSLRTESLIFLLKTLRIKLNFLFSSSLTQLFTQSLFQKFLDSITQTPNNRKSRFSFSQESNNEINEKNIISLSARLDICNFLEDKEKAYDKLKLLLESESVKKKHLFLILNELENFVGVSSFSSELKDKLSTRIISTQWISKNIESIQPLISIHNAKFHAEDLCEKIEQSINSALLFSARENYQFFKHSLSTLSFLSLEISPLAYLKFLMELLDLGKCGIGFEKLVKVLVIERFITDFKKTEVSMVNLGNSFRIEVLLSASKILEESSKDVKNFFLHSLLNSLTLLPLSFSTLLFFFSEKYICEFSNRICQVIVARCIRKKVLHVLFAYFIVVWMRNEGKKKRSSVTSVSGKSTPGKTSNSTRKISMNRFPKREDDFYFHRFFKFIENSENKTLGIIQISHFFLSKLTTAENSKLEVAKELFENYFKCLCVSVQKRKDIIEVDNCLMTKISKLSENPDSPTVLSPNHSFSNLSNTCSPMKKTDIQNKTLRFSFNPNSVSLTPISSQRVQEIKKRQPLYEKNEIPDFKVKYLK